MRCKCRTNKLIRCESACLEVGFESFVTVKCMFERFHRFYCNQCTRKSEFERRSPLWRSCLNYRFTARILVGVCSQTVISIIRGINSKSERVCLSTLVQMYWFGCLMFQVFLLSNNERNKLTVYLTNTVKKNKH